MNWILILHDIIPKKRDPLRTNICDVQLENFSLLTIFPSTLKYYDISLASEGSHLKDPHVVISPCYVETEQFVDSVREIPIRGNSENRAPGLDSPLATHTAATEEATVDSTQDDKCDDKETKCANDKGSVTEESEPGTEKDNEEGPSEPSKQTGEELSPDNLIEVTILDVTARGLSLSNKPSDLATSDPLKLKPQNSPSDKVIEAPGDESKVVEETDKHLQINGETIGTKEKEQKIKRSDDTGLSCSKKKTSNDTTKHLDKETIWEEKTINKFISAPNLDDVVKKLNAKPLISWIKACELKPSHTAEKNRQILSKHLTLVS